MSAVLSSDFNKRIIQLVAPLQENPWRDCPKGTMVTRQESEGDPTKNGAASTIEVHYEVVEQGQSVHRIQNIKGRSKRQEFMVTDEQGLTKAGLDCESIHAALNIDNVLVISELRKINTTTTDYERIVKVQFDQWSLAAYPSILLRHNTEFEHWSILSLQAQLKVNGKTVPCIEVELRKQISPVDFMITRKKLSFHIPGHLGEESCIRVQINKETGQSTRQIISHQIVTGIIGRIHNSLHV